MHSLILLLLLGQTAPEIKLTVPEKPVSFARSVRMKIDPPIKGEAPSDWVSYSVEWDVTERSLSDNPLENDLDVDSNTLKASIPSGLNPTQVKVKVVVTFVYKDNSTRVARDTKFVTIGTQPGPAPGPGPVPPPGPGPGQGPVIPPAPAPIHPAPPEAYGMTTWTKGQLLKASLSKEQAATLGESFHTIADMARNGALGTDKNAAISAMAEKNRNTLGSNLQTWIDGFLQPLQVKINPMNPKIKTVADQAILFDEIGYGLDAYGGK